MGWSQRGEEKPWLQDQKAPGPGEERGAESSEVSAVPSTPAIFTLEHWAARGLAKNISSPSPSILSPERQGGGWQGAGCGDRELGGRSSSFQRLGCLESDWEGGPSFQRAPASREPKNKLIFVIFGNPSRPRPHEDTLSPSVIRNCHHHFVLFPRYSFTNSRLVALWSSYLSFLMAAYYSVQGTFF